MLLNLSLVLTGFNPDLNNSKIGRLINNVDLDQTWCSLGKFQNNKTIQL